MQHLTPAELDQILERYDQTDPALQRQIVGRLIQREAIVAEDRDRLLILLDDIALYDERAAVALRGREAEVAEARRSIGS